MSDLVQKIAKDACRILGYSMVDSIVHEKLREAIRQALADAGGAVAWRFNVDGMWFTASKREYCHKAIADAGIEAEIEPLYTHPAPSADRVAELEAQLAELRDYHMGHVRGAQISYDGFTARIVALEQQLAESRERRGRMREALKGVMLWIKNWEPDFTNDAEWPEYEEAALEAIAAEQEKK